MKARHACRACGRDLDDVFVDLGASPLANAYVTQADLAQPERTYPLCVYVCASCLLVQLPAHETPEQIFGEYAYFSSYADSWVEHARRFAAAAVTRFALDESSLVLELASNDGYLLRWFVEAGIPVLGVEPARNVATVARERGVETIAEFFGVALARRITAARGRAQLIVANNVLAHVPDLHDFVGGIAVALAPNGSASIEFPHLMRLMESTQYDTIYHEHFSYFSLVSLEPVLAAHGLHVADVEELPTHGGSVRLTIGYGTGETPAVARVRGAERAAGLHAIDAYRGFAARVAANKAHLVDFLTGAAERGERVAAYGAPAKGNTLLNYAGVGSDLVAYTVDRNPYKQGRYLPGSRIPIRSPDELLANPPDYLLVLPWNLIDEIRDQMAALVRVKTRFVIAIPDLTVLA